jgi:hypothetical protein
VESWEERARQRRARERGGGECRSGAEVRSGAARGETGGGERPAGGNGRGGGLRTRDPCGLNHVYGMDSAWLGWEARFELLNRVRLRGCFRMRWA